MVTCRITCANPLAGYLTISLEIPIEQGEQSLALQLPSWRPGRYMLQHFAKNIRGFTALDAHGKSLDYHKVTRDRWVVDIGDCETVTIQYEYFARKMDAGSCWIDEQQWYLNFSNCIMYPVEGEELAYQVQLDVPDSYRIACALPQSGKILQATTYYELADSPVICSNRLKHWELLVDETQYHLWFMGTPPWEERQVLNHFKAFIRAQTDMMGPFPSDSYHFLYQLLPYKFYHGVEHGNSTVITLGPETELGNQTLYKDFLGVSSHELFHAWNIIRIRPAEMQPYRFETENYFNTGFVAEGFTTYLGDLFLIRSGVFSVPDYLEELNKVLKKHADNTGRYFATLSDSSIDLWLDGYEAGAPGRKVSIYTEGSLLTLLIDLRIREQTGGQSGIDQVMHHLWAEFGQKSIGYRWTDIQAICERLTGSSWQDFFKDFLFGTKSLSKELAELLPRFACELQEVNAEESLARYYGIQVENDPSGNWTIKQLAPQSPGVEALMVGDVLMGLNGNKLTDPNSIKLNKSGISLLINRFGRLVEIVLSSGSVEYFSYNKIILTEQPTPKQLLRFKGWLRQEFPH